MKTNELLTYIFSGSGHPFAGLFGGWLDGSPAFKAFAEAHRDKIRKKVRTVRDAETRRDLEAELATAVWLLQERRCTLEYERYSAEGGRGPDFTVTFRTSVRFNVEVTRLRDAAPSASPADPPPAEPGSLLNKILNTLGGKLGQMPPSIVNVLALVADSPAYTADDIAAALRLLAERAARHDDEFFVRRGFAGTRDFQRQWARLSAVSFRSLAAAPPAPPALWPNSQARHPLPADQARLLQR